MREGYNHEDVTTSLNCSAEEDASILTYTEEYETDVCDIKSGVEETICDTLNTLDEASVDSDEWGTACTGVEACDGDTSAGKAILKGEIESMLEEWSSCVTPGEKVCEACDILSKALYGELGKATGTWAPLCEDEDEPLVGANESACAHAV